jgi:ribosomal protein S21
MYVEVKGERPQDLERALQLFTKLVKRSELMTVLRGKESYLKKSKKLKKKREEALRRRKREESKAKKRNNTV